VDLEAKPDLNHNAAMTLMTPTRIDAPMFGLQVGGHETTTGKKRLEMVQAEAKTV
jgi:hypothetical protein